MGVQFPETLTMRDADVMLYRNFFDPDEGHAFFKTLRDNTPWRYDITWRFGRPQPVPRGTVFYNYKFYTYSGITPDPAPWPPTLLAIKGEIEAVADVHFNSVLLNLYRDGQDSVSWHSDNEPALGQNPVIGSVSFGAMRSFHFRHKHDPKPRTKIALAHGSFLLMQGMTQHFWHYQVPKTKHPCGPRINLTFRVIKPREQVSARRSSREYGAFSR